MNINEREIFKTSISKPRAFKERGVLYLCVLLLSLFFHLPLSAGQISFQPIDSASNSLTASLITCWPGSEIYELCGHEAIRIKGDGIDSVWNFGLFNFNEPNFVYRFVKGETDYNVAGYPFEYFLPEYIRRGSRVEEQVLNLTPEEVTKLRRLLQVHSTPPNDRYRYNYIKNNCSTQIADVLENASVGKILFKDTVLHSTYRNEMRDYHRNYPWYQFGIDIALGSGLEEEISQRQELFVPVEFNRHAANAYLPDGRPLVTKTNVLNEGSDSAVLPPTPWVLTPVFFSLLVLAVTIMICVSDWQKHKISKWWYSVFFGVVGLAGCLVAFLVFISVHEATSPNILIFWLNPLQLLIPVFIWVRKIRMLTTVLMWYNVCAVGLMLVMLPFYVNGQGGQWALPILMLADLILASTYLYVIRIGKGDNKHSKFCGRQKRSTARVSSVSSKGKSTAKKRKSKR